MKGAKLLIWALFCPFFVCATSIYDEIDPLPFDGVGYFAAEPILDKLMKEREIKTVIEIGSWAGASTRFLAHRVGPEGKVYAIDHWLGTPEHPGEMNDHRLSYIYHLFLSNIQHFDLGDRVVPIRMSSNEALKALSHVQADLIFIDGPRKSQQVYEAIMGWYPHLTDMGVICGTEWRAKSVRDGVMRAVEELGFQVETDKKGLTWVLY